VLAAQSLFTRTLPQAAALLVLLILLALVITLAWASWASKRLGGGLTGDTYGALNELVELGVLILAPPMALLVLHLFSLLR
jgi:cobalamin synthase